MELQKLAESIRGGISLEADHRSGGATKYVPMRYRSALRQPSGSPRDCTLTRWIHRAAGERRTALSHRWWPSMV